MKKLLLLLLFCIPAHATVSCFANVGRDGLGTSTAINTTGATVIYALITSFTTNATLTDSNSNTYSYTTDAISGSLHLRIAYKFAPTTSASTTFTLSGSSTFPAAAIQACSGTVTTGSPANVITGTPTSSGTGTVQCGSISPVAAGDLIVEGAGLGAVFTSTINQSFSTPFIVGAGSNEEVGESHLPTTVSTSVNPTWSTNKNTITFLCTAAVFKTASPISSSSAHTWIF